MKYKVVHIIFNPNSTGPSQAMARQLKSQLEDSYPETEIKLRATEYAGHAEKLARQAALKHKNILIVSASGDGGYNEVINGAMQAQSAGADPVCAVLAAGNANDHSRSVHDLPLVELIKQDRLSQIDLLKAEINQAGQTSTRYAHSYIGLGLTPVVAVELNKTSLNALKEIWIVLKTFYKFRPFKLQIDGRIVKLDSIIFANIGQMAKILTLAQSARIDDGQFEVVTLPHSHKLRVARIFTKAVFSGLKPMKYRHFEFTVIKKMPAQFDGEVIYLAAGTKITISAAKKALKSIV